MNQSQQKGPLESDNPAGASPDRVAELARKLHGLGNADRHGVTLGVWPERLADWAFVPLASASVFILMLLVAAGMNATGLWQVPQRLELPVVVFLSGLGIVAVSLQTLGGIAGLWQEWRRGGEIKAWRAKRDMGHALDLLAWAGVDVAVADQWLETEVKRLEGRLALFFGGADKVALLVFIGMGWAITSELMDGLLLAYPTPTWCVMAFFVGLALGGLAARRELLRLQYQRGLIVLSKTLRKPSEDGRLWQASLA